MGYRTAVDENEAELSTSLL